MEKFREMVHGWLGTALLVLLLIPFVFFGIESYFSGGGHSLTVATVNGQSISQPEFERSFEMAHQQAVSKLGANADPSQIDLSKLRSKVMDGLIDRDIERQAADELSLSFPERQIWPLLAQAPAFMGTDGKFDMAHFQAFLRQRNQTEAELFNEIKVGGQLQQVEFAMSTAFDTKPQVDRLLKIDGQSRDMGYALLPAASLVAQVVIPDADVAAWYKAHAAQLMVPEQVGVDYLEFKQDSLLPQISVSADELNKAYQDALKSVQSQEQRHAEHILIKVGGAVSDAQALAKITKIAQQLKPDGSNFATLAQQNSQDEGSASSGGDLGFAARGQFVPEFDKVLFALQPGQISSPVRTSFGYHIIRLMDIKKPEVPTQLAMKDQLTQAVRQDKVQQMFADQVNSINDAVYEAPDLKEPATKLGVPVQTSAVFSVHSGVGLAALPKFRAMAFSDDVLRNGKNSGALELSKGDVVWMHIHSHSVARPETLAEAHAAIVAHLTEAREMALAHAHLQQAMDSIAKGQDPTTVLHAQGLVWTQVKVGRSDTTVPDAKVLQTVFWLPRPSAGHFSMRLVNLPQGVALVQLKDVQDGSLSSARIPPAQALNMLNQVRASQYEADYIQSIKAKAVVKRTALGNELLHKTEGS